MLREMQGPRCSECGSTIRCSVCGDKIVWFIQLEDGMAGSCYDCGTGYKHTAETGKVDLL